MATCTTPTKRATIAITTGSTSPQQVPKKAPKNRMSLDDYKSFIAILLANNPVKPALSINPTQWSIQQESRISLSSVEYSAYLSNIDPNDEHLYPFDEDELSDASSSFDLERKSETELEVADGNILREYGYKINKLLSHTINGCLYSAEIVDDDFNEKKDKDHNKINLPSSMFISKKKCEVRIKKFEKENGDSIIAEALILQYLTMTNIPPNPNICKYIDFVETKHTFYLIQQYGKYITLDELILSAHKYLTQKRMKKMHWRIIVKYLFWQLIATLHWMHQDMKVCHLELNTMNIVVENAKIIENLNTGFHTIDTKSIRIKLVDFGQSEIFELDCDAKDENMELQCSKNDILCDFFYKDPKVLNGEVFNPIKADMYSVGMILFKMFTGTTPYKRPEYTDKGYMALKENKLRQYMKENKILKGISKYIIRLLVDLLTFKEEERITTIEVLSNEWFKNYYIRYKKSIQQKSKSQKERHLRQMDQYKLPYYKLKK